MANETPLPSENRKEIKKTLAPRLVSEPLKSEIDKELSERKDAPAGTTRPPKSYEVIIELNLNHPGSRLGARDVVLRILHEIPGVDPAIALRRNSDDASHPYVFATLSAEQIAELVRRDGDLASELEKDPERADGKSVPRRTLRAIFRIWESQKVHPLTTESIRTVKANAAHNCFGAFGEKIVWAVLDSGFLDAVEARVSDALARLPGAEVVYTAHSVPLPMAQSSPYVQQLRQACATVNERLALGEPVLVYQSRSGPATQPWLEPDIGDYIRSTEARRLVVEPIGFLSDHMEVLYDLDTEAAAEATRRGIEFLRAGTAGTHPRFVAGIREMVEAAMASGVRACPAECCKPSARPAGRSPL